MLLRKSAPFLFFSLLLFSCVEVYDIRYNLNADVLTVDGFVTNERGLTVNLRLSRSTGRDYYSQPLRDCVVEVKVGDGSVIALKEFSSGVYVAPASFQGQVGQTYQLHFKTPEGKVWAKQIFEKAKTGYHATTVEAIGNLLKWKKRRLALFYWL